MAPALLATVGMTNVTTANKRAAQLANDHAATREALDAANDTLGKMCLALSKAGLTGDALAGVQRLVAERDLARQECKDLSSSLDWWEALARRHLWPNVPLATDKTDRHFDLRSALNDRLNTLTTERDTHARAAETAEMQLREVSRLLGPRRVVADLASATVKESVVGQAERARAILDRWQDLAVRLLPACPQLSSALCGADLGTRHFELRGFIGGEIQSLRDKLVVATEREAQASGQAKSALDLRSLSDARSSLSKWQTWGRNKIGVNATVSDENLRNAIDDYAGAQIAGWKAEAKRTFTQLQEAHAALDGHEALTANAKEDLKALIARPGRGLTAELAYEAAKYLLARLESGLPTSLRHLIDMALYEGANAAVRLYDGESRRYRAEAEALRKETKDTRARLEIWAAALPL